GQPCLGIVDGWRSDAPVYTDFQLLHCSQGWVVERGGFDNLLIRFAADSGARVLSEACECRLVSSPLDVEQRIRLNAAGLLVSFVVEAPGIGVPMARAAFTPRSRYDRLVVVRMPLGAHPDPPEWMHLACSSDGWWYVVSPKKGPPQAVFLTDSDLLPRC